MMLQIGASDTTLQRELGAIKNPTLPAFNMKIEGFVKARKTTASTAHGNAASKPSSQRRNSEPAQPKNNCSSNNQGRGERDRHLALRGCGFRCAKEITCCRSVLIRSTSNAISARNGSYFARLQSSTKCSCDSTTSAFLFPRIATASPHMRRLFPGRQSFVLDFTCSGPFHFLSSFSFRGFLHSGQHAYS